MTTQTGVKVAGPWRSRHAGAWARETPTMDQLGYPVLLVEELAREFRWSVRNMEGDTVATGVHFALDTAEALAEAAARQAPQLGWEFP